MAAWSGKPIEMYYRLMTPEWLANNNGSADIHWDANFKQEDLHLKVDPDSRDYERVVRVKLLDQSVLNRAGHGGADLTVKIRAGLKYTGGTPPDPISFTVSDGEHAFGFQLLDMTRYHVSGYGPYYPIEGASGHYNFSPPIIQKDLAKPSNEYSHWPMVFEMRLKPSDGFGTIYTALDAGHNMSAKFRSLQRLKQNGLLMEVYRGDAKEHYDIEYIEVTITDTHP